MQQNLRYDNKMRLWGSLWCSGREKREREDRQESQMTKERMALADEECSNYIVAHEVERQGARVREKKNESV